MSKWNKEVKQKLQEKSSENKNIRSILFELSNQGGFVLKPIKLISIFEKWLSKNHQSKMNTQQARNMAEVYCTLCHIFHIAKEKYKIQEAFSVSQSVWKKLCIGQGAVKNSIVLLKEMGLLHFYKHQRNKDPQHTVRMYKLNRFMLEFVIRQAELNEKAETSQDADELEFEDWGEFKGKRKQIVRVKQASEKSTVDNQDDYDLNDFEDLNEMFDNGFYFS